MIVVVRHPNDRHVAVEAEELTKSGWGFKSLLQLVAVEGRAVYPETPGPGLREIPPERSGRPAAMNRG